MIHVPTHNTGSSKVAVAQTARTQRDSFRQHLRLGFQVANGRVYPLLCYGSASMNEERTPRLKPLGKRPQPGPRFGNRHSRINTVALLFVAGPFRGYIEAYIFSVSN